MGKYRARSHGPIWDVPTVSSTRSVLVKEENQELKCIEPENVQNISKSFNSYMNEAWWRSYQIDSNLQNLLNMARSWKAKGGSTKISKQALKYFQKYLSEDTFLFLFFGPGSESQTTIKLNNETLPSVVLSNLTLWFCFPFWFLATLFVFGSYVHRPSQLFPIGDTNDRESYDGPFDDL